MANRDDIWDDNVRGSSEIDGKKVSFFVDRECILCSVCHECAPKNFRMADSEEYDICFKQPTNKEELEACYEAMENCPVEAIGDDGPN